MVVFFYYISYSTKITNCTNVTSYKIQYVDEWLPYKTLALIAILINRFASFPLGHTCLLRLTYLTQLKKSKKRDFVEVYLFF